MTHKDMQGEKPRKQAPMHFWDLSKHHAWSLANLASANLEAREEHFAQLRSRVLALRGEPRSQHIVKAWERAMEGGRFATAKALVTMSPEGEFLRDTGLHALILRPDQIEQALLTTLRERQDGLVAYDSMS